MLVRVEMEAGGMHVGVEMEAGGMLVGVEVGVGGMLVGVVGWVEVEVEGRCGRVPRF
jgi:hypothetical protein